MERVVIYPEEILEGAPMQQRDRSVRDLKLIYPETGFRAMTLCLGVVEIEPGHHSPLHRHNCEEVYYVVQGMGEFGIGWGALPAAARLRRTEPPERAASGVQYGKRNTPPRRGGRDHAGSPPPAVADSLAVRGVRGRYGRDGLATSCGAERCARGGGAALSRQPSRDDPAERSVSQRWVAAAGEVRGHVQGRSSRTGCFATRGLSFSVPAGWTR
jgi:hypothetical protein